MKNWFKLMLLSFACVAFAACDDQQEVNPNPQLEVTPNNIAGEWELLSYDAGATLPEGCYVRISFERKDRTYTLCQNTDSFTEHTLTGSYNILTDPTLGSILVGNYDYNGGEWAHRYIVRSLTAKQMVWVAKDAPEQVQVFARKK